MKIFILLVSLFLFTSINALEKEVFICGNKGAQKYHFTNNCRGLSNCKHEIKKAKLSEAQNLKLTLCGWED